MKEDVLEVGGERALATGNALQSVVHTEGVDHGFGSQHAGFAGALVVGNASPDVGCAGQPASRGQSRVGGEIQRMLIVEPHGVGTLRIGDEESGGDAAHGNKPLGVGKLQAEWAGPDRFLVFGQMDEEFALVGMSNGAVGKRLNWRSRRLRLARAGWRILLGEDSRGAESQKNNGEEELGQTILQKRPRVSLAF